MGKKITSDSSSSSDPLVDCWLLAVEDTAWDAFTSANPIFDFGDFAPTMGWSSDAGGGTTGGSVVAGFTASTSAGAGFVAVALSAGRALSLLLLLRQRWEQRSLHPMTEERYQQQGLPPAELYRQHSSSCGPCFVDNIFINNNIYEVVFKSCL